MEILFYGKIHTIVLKELFDHSWPSGLSGPIVGVFEDNKNGQGHNSPGKLENYII